jgi:ribosomal protein L11 methyltransferase
MDRALGGTRPTYAGTETDVVSGFSRTVIVIQPSMGFGTGHHATTRLCLAALQNLDLKGQRVIDVGTGSGVLAIAASLLGADRVVAIDDDPDAIQAARENVTLNEGAKVETHVTDLRSFESRIPNPESRFDIVLANLTGGLLIQAAERLQALARTGGHLVLSGFMAHEAADVLCAYSALAVRSRTDEDEWACVVLG